jgi:uncharacterized protein (TIGR00375 family)
MRYIGDFHIHSKFSRATSQQIDLKNLEKWAKIKGVFLMGTGDFTHPEWFDEIKKNLEPAENGLFKIKGSKENVRFILTTEVSCVYTKNGKVRKIHIVIFAPSIQVVEKINTQLSWSFNLKADGRPILGIDAKELVKMILEISLDCLIVPAHIWTPWFSLFGSKSGFNSIEECFEELSSQIFALETGLSSDPKMNWRLSALDKYTLISNSDSHSLQKIAREANIFEGKDINYKKIIEAIKKGGKERGDLNMVATIEFFPEEGKYHYDGHRFCEVRFSPQETKKYGGICPVCKKPLTVGVLSRVEELADRNEGERPKTALPFISLVPLAEIIAEVFNQNSSTSKFVENKYFEMISTFGSEFEILLDIPTEEIEKDFPEIAQGIKIVREGKVKITPGYDGEFGKVNLFGNKEEQRSLQKTLF